MRLTYAPCWLDFKTPATTSRGTMTRKLTCFLKLYDEKNPEVFGLGEAALFPGLSPEANDRFEVKLLELTANVALGKPTDLSRYSSIQYGFEQAIQDFASGGQRHYYNSPFLQGENPLTINGLVWMGDIETMRQQAQEKIAAGFKCLKFKIGALEWEEELKMLAAVRKEHSELEIRVDANGGLPWDRVERILGQLADLNIASIEQPIPPGYFREMGILCRQSPVPIALDEELIGVFDPEERRAMLSHVRPAYIILKAALCGGFSGAEDWIAVADNEGIGWWVTSALESNVGLTALAQWTAGFGQRTREMAQGLGTGALYVDNTPTRLLLRGEELSWCPKEETPGTLALSSLEWYG